VFLNYTRAELWPLVFCFGDSTRETKRDLTRFLSKGTAARMQVALTFVSLLQTKPQLSPKTSHKNCRCNDTLL
jgi:hypothetical protein